MSEVSWWDQRWRENRTGWHKDAPHPLLARWWPALGVAAGARVLVPLAGASHDIDWLLARGYAVDAVEVSETAIDRYFARRGVQPERQQLSGHVLRRHRRLRFFQADFLELEPHRFGTCDAVYDRAALIALDAATRPVYAAQVQRLCSPAARQLLITLEFPSWLRPGPPHSVARAEVEALYGSGFSIRVLGRYPERDRPQREVVYGLAAA